MTIILSCNSGNKQENLIQSNYVDSENTSTPTDVADSVNVSNENKNSSYSSNPTMSREEDAYEEGRALKVGDCSLIEFAKVE